MVYHLLGQGHATAPELAERFEVSVRTIYRDVLVHLYEWHQLLIQWVRGNRQGEGGIPGWAEARLAHTLSALLPATTSGRLRN